MISAICHMMLFAIYVNDTTLYSNCDQAFDLWQRLELASELYCDLQDIDWGINGLFFLMQEKLSFLCLSNVVTLVLLMWKLMSLFLKEMFFLRSWDWSSSSKLDWCSYIGSIAKIDWFVIGNFFLLRLLFISLNLPYSLVWNTVVMCVAPSCYLNLLDKLLKRLCSTDFLEPFAHHRKIIIF